MTPFRIAIMLTMVCGVAAWQVTLIPESLMQMTVGPTLVPALLVAGLCLLALIYGVSAWRGQQVDESQNPDQSPVAGANQRFLVLLGGGLVFVTLVVPLGFIIPSALCGLCVARAFGAPIKRKSTLICGSIASVVWIVFAQILGVGLGPGLPWPF